MADDADAPPVADLTLEHLRALRREMRVMLEWRGDVMRLLTGIVTRIDRLDEDIRSVRGEIAALDIKDITRQDEILTILRKLAHVDKEGPTPASFVPK